MTIVDKIEDAGKTAEDLDNITHHAASQLASNANNGGIAEQINFLRVVCGWSDFEITNSIGMEN